MGGSGNPASGYVEALGTNGLWGGLCTHGFDINDAHVVCRMLGYPSAAMALAEGTAFDIFGIAPSGHSFVLDDLDCQGNETSIFDCSHNGEWNENCVFTDIAGIQCATGNI